MASEVLGRRRKCDHLFGMGSPGVGTRWLAEARHGSAFQHLETTAAVTSVRYQCFFRRSGGSWRDLTCVQRMRVHFCPQQWLLCHMGLY